MSAHDVALAVRLYPEFAWKVNEVSQSQALDRRASASFALCRPRFGGCCDISRRAVAFFCLKTSVMSIRPCLNVFARLVSDVYVSVLDALRVCRVVVLWSCAPRAEYRCLCDLQRLREATTLERVLGRHRKIA